MSNPFAIEHIVYLWKTEDGTPYYISKCRSDSQAPFTAKSNCEPPTNPECIEIKYRSTNEQAVIEVLDTLQYQIGLVAAAPGFGTLKNRVSQNPRSLLERGSSHAQPVEVWSVAGDLISMFPSLGVASYHLGVKRQNASACLAGKIYQTGGYVFTNVGEGFRENSLWRGRSTLTPVSGYDPEGALFHFESLRAASKHVSPGNSAVGRIRNSISSPHTDKKTVNGWIFFDADGVLPEYSDVKKKKPRGRSGSKKKE